jgi:SAM-dependent methyltransferase
MNKLKFEGYFKYWIYYIKNAVLNLFGRHNNNDDFDWELYNIHYRGEMILISDNHNMILEKGDYFFSDGILQKRSTKLPLHDNHFLQFETILQLSPSSVLELGCGGGDHLFNLSVLSPSIKLFGVDRSIQQIKFLRERHPNLTADISQWDCTLPFPSHFEKVDLAYTQAVLMHIQTGNGHLLALLNLFKIATKQVMLMENWSRHDFISDINMLWDLGLIEWPELYTYYRVSPELNRPHLILASSTPLPGFSLISKEIASYFK